MFTRRLSVDRTLPAGILVVLLSTAPAWARSTGYLMSELSASGYATSGCNGCHSGGGPPTVRITVGDGDGVAMGATVPVEVRISSVNGHNGGFSLRAASGTLADHGDYPARYSSNRREATHTQPWEDLEDPGNVIFKVDWTAPNTMGTVRFEAWGLSSSGREHSYAHQAFQDVVVGCPRYFTDADGDGYGVNGPFVETCGTQPPKTATRGGDCDDTNAAIHPGRDEVCNGVDDNCNGEIDEVIYDAPALCTAAGQICWGGTCQAPPSLDAGTPDGGSSPDGGSDGGSQSDGGTTPPGSGDAGIADGGTVTAEPTGGCASAATGAASLPLLLLGWGLLRRRCTH